MIRYIMTMTFIWSFLVLSIPVMLIEFIIGKFNMNFRNTSSLALVKMVFRMILFITGTKTTYLGEENIPTDTPVLYVGNHRSSFDILITYIRVPRLTGYVAKKELEKTPLLNVWMKFLHCLFLDRHNIKEGLKTVLTGVEKMKNGISLCIFPEGTRSLEKDEFLPFHEGSFKIAERAECPIIPMTLVNTSAIWEDQFPKMKKAHVVVEYGAPIYLHELSKEERKAIGSKVREQMIETYHKNKAIYFPVSE